MEISLDDAFADFLNEVDEVVASDAPPSPKRPRKTTTESAEDAAEAAARTKRLARAEKLRKASFVGDVSKIDRILGALSIVDRLLLVDCSDPDDGFTPLHLAVIRKHIDCVTALLRYRADIDAQSDAGDTPLMWAAAQGSLDICKTLLNAGADCKLKNAKGATAATQAQAARHRRVFEMLENYEIDVATGLHRKGAAVMDAAAARRAANMAMVQAAIRAQQEKEEEDAFWNAVKQRREKRGSSVQSDAKTVRETDEALEEGTRKAKVEDFLALPEKIRPHYLLLEAPPDAEVEEIRKLYRKLALKNHPDKNPLDLVGSKERFTKIAEAYEAVCQYLGSVEKVGVRIAPPKL